MKRDKARHTRDKPNHQAKGNWAGPTSSLTLKIWTHDVRETPQFIPGTVFAVTVRLRMDTLYDVG